jgi:hypothetical protein
VIVRDDVPAPGVDDEAVRTELSLRLLTGKRVVSGVEAAAATDRVGELEHERRIRGCTARRGREVERLLERLDLAAERRGQHSVDLRQRSGDGIRGAIAAGLAGREEAEHDRDRLLVFEHQRRQPIPRADPVAAADASLSFDRDSEALQDADVAPHRARVDLEPVGDLAPGRQRPRLEQLEQLEQARGRRGHLGESSTDSGRKAPYFPLLTRET